jgi:hypothetical protein
MWRNSVLRVATACVGLSLVALTGAAAPARAQSGVADFYGAWGQQPSDRNRNEWRENCAEQQGNVLILTADRILTTGTTWVYKDYPECKVINASEGAQLLVRAQCFFDPEDAEEVTLEYDVLSEGGGRLRIQRRGQVGTEYLKCPSDSWAARKVR